jgi:hypothetical protein
MADTNPQVAEMFGMPKLPVVNTAPSDKDLIIQSINKIDQSFKDRNRINEEIQKLTKQNVGIEKDIGGIQQQQAEMKASGEARAAAEQKREEEAAINQYKRLIDEQPLPAFIPTKDSGMDLAKLMSSIAVMGTLMGRKGIGGQSAANAMSAMTGMMTGWQQGRQDLYKKEADEFKKNYERMLRVHQEFRKDMEDAIKLAATDKEASEKAVFALAVKSGSPIIAMQAKKGDNNAIIKSLEATSKLDDEISKLAEKQYEAASKRAFDRTQQAERLAADIARQQAGFAHAEKIERLREKARLEEIKARGEYQEKVAKAKAAGAAAQEKMPIKSIVDANDFRNDTIPKLVKGLDTIDRLEKEGRWGEFTVLLGLGKKFGLGANVAESSFKNDPDAIDLAATFALFQSQEFQTAGKSLTKNEDAILSPLYKPDFRSYEGIRNAMSNGIESMSKRQSTEESMIPWIKTYNEIYRKEKDSDSLVTSIQTPVTPSAPAAPAKSLASPSRASALARPAAPKEFTTLDEVESAAKKGLIKSGDTVIVNGKTGTYRQ